MKKFLVVILIILTAVSNAQDKIYFSSGKLVHAKLVKVNRDQVKYYDLDLSPTTLRTVDRLSIKKIRRYEKDTSNYIAFGVIPYQLLSRSTGGFLTYKFKKPASVDYRYTYTFATEHLSNYIHYSKLFFQGDNHTLVFTYHRRKKGRSWGLMLGYKHWWFSQKTIPLEGVSLHSSFSRSFGPGSSNIRGVNYGLEYSRDLSVKNFHCIFFMNLSVTEFCGLHTGFGPPYDAQMNFTYHESKYKVEYVHAAIGFKIGGRIKLKNNI